MKNLSIQKVSQIISVVLGFVLLVSPVVGLAQIRDLCGSTGGTNLSCTFGGASSVSQIILTVINIILALSGLIAVLVLIIGGFRYVTSFGNEDAVKNGKSMILNALIGIVIIILAFVIVRVVQNFFLHPNAL